MIISGPIELLNEHEPAADVGTQAKRRNACLLSMI